MAKWLFALFLFFSTVHAQTPGCAEYKIFPLQRGQDIISLFTLLNTNSAYKNTSGGISEVAIQTANQGLIHNVQSIAGMNNFTILFINYLPSIGSYQKYTTVVFTEQILEIVYSNTQVNGSKYVPNFAVNVIPYFPIDMTARMQDIVQAIKSLVPYTFPNNYGTLSLSTTLNGSFYQPISGGVIPQIQAVPVQYDTLMLVQFSPQGLYPTPYYIVVSPDQVTQINYSGTPALNF